MIHNIKRLHHIAEKNERLIIGLMSGTSLDGLDIALCSFKYSGFNTKFKLKKFKTFVYTSDLKKDVLEIFAKKQVDLQKLTLLNAKIGDLHAQMILETLTEWEVEPKDVDLIASHGQTIYHAPKRLHGLPDYLNATLQIGDGDHIAVKTGIITISDFRQKHIAAGGEGAPLALYGDVILGSKAGENRLLLNIGGIANITYLPGQRDEILCTDIGPGNTIIDAACRKYFNVPFDEDAKIAFSGTINEQLLNELSRHPFFEEQSPKTTGPELFNLDYVLKAQQLSNTTDIALNDLVATLSMFTARVIINTVKDLKVDALFVSGGGARNPFIINQLKSSLPGITINDTNALGIDPDAKEAILFALLANEAVAGEPIKIGNNPAVLMGKFSFPV
ncbi:anhydro-N-acetylmuramic acid kinase [Mucilaginibacter sp. KACC 22063]|uniref:anhydro-N-acetylmuramic acid kinase n=1 Tax=Mucilaginibacter sp. KACC 22063 TaxID=3025666 RepID=UPI002366A547|nr:anhydro-N-acetylmuramic acid kinase [Mucilaginibacter sp. KACC 22063]WDF55069.1 anhydro-N-acetylmuramic acid kinase [Mucilaginibacter sp. KACC 22063]